MSEPKPLRLNIESFKHVADGDIPLSPEVARLIEEDAAHVENLCRAFVRETGLHPSKCLLVRKHRDDGSVEWCCMVKPEGWSELDAGTVASAYRAERDALFDQVERLEAESAGLREKVWNLEVEDRNAYLSILVSCSAALGPLPNGGRRFAEMPNEIAWLRERVRTLQRRAEKAEAALAEWEDPDSPKRQALLEETVLGVGDGQRSEVDLREAQLYATEAVLAEERLRVQALQQGQKDHDDELWNAEQDVADMKAERDGARADLQNMLDGGPHDPHDQLDALYEEIRKERDEARAERDRLLRWLERIDGGDAPCTDEGQLRQWAYEAITLGRTAEEEKP